MTENNVILECNKEYAEVKMGLHPVWPAGFCPVQKQEGDCCDALHVPAL